MCSISLYSKPCWAIIFLTRLRFPPGTSIAMISLFTFECSEFHWKTMNIKHQTNQLARFSKSQNKLKLRNVLRMERFKNANICIPPTFQETVGSHLKPSLPVVVMATLNQFNSNIFSGFSKQYSTCKNITIHYYTHIL